jgi:hypothetical protein
MATTARRGRLAEARLLEAVSNVTAARGVPLVLVLVNGRPVTFNGGGAGSANALLDRVDALLVAWRPGQLGAQARSRDISPLFLY